MSAARSLHVRTMCPPAGRGAPGAAPLERAPPPRGVRGRAPPRATAAPLFPKRFFLAVPPSLVARLPARETAPRGKAAGYAHPPRPRRRRLAARMATAPHRTLALPCPALLCPALSSPPATWRALPLAYVTLPMPRRGERGRVIASSPAAPAPPPALAPRGARRPPGPSRCRSEPALPENRRCAPPPRAVPLHSPSQTFPRARSPQWRRGSHARLCLGRCRPAPAPFVTASPAPAASRKFGLFSLLPLTAPRSRTRAATAASPHLLLFSFSIRSR